MRFSRIIPGILISIIACAFGVAPQTSPPNKQIVIAASTVLDGKGGVLRNTRIVVEGSKIVHIDPNAGPVTYDLRGLTVLPGWIDGHVHITWDMVKKAAGGKRVLETRVPGTAKDGSPTCATVKPFAGWKVV